MLREDAKAIYLDYAATTPVDPAVADAMSRYLTASGTFANPSSIHSAGRQAAAAADTARSTCTSGNVALAVCVSGVGACGPGIPRTTGSRRNREVCSGPEHSPTVQATSRNLRPPCSRNDALPSIASAACGYDGV
ncbi:MAG: aminotransferase class V-fold PLP-dependent enzyme [Nitrospirae bacterium]|nr:aminotransferase class V-fold PLP-dependent enzyme [Nitrospirota bacterium]